jgi:phage FluMu protein Com
MKEYYCRECNTALDVTFSKNEMPSGKCPKCKTVYKNLDEEIENHMTYRDNIRHCPNCGKGFRTNYGPREHGGKGYGLQFHKCERCGWIVGWQHTFSHGEYVVAMKNEELFKQRQYFWEQLKKYGMTSTEGDEEYR